MIALMTSAFAVIGCDSGSGQSASEVCDACVSNLKGACESAYNTCIAADPGGNVQEKCAAAGLAACGI